MTVCRILHKLQLGPIEPCNEQFKGMFEGHGQMPEHGLTNTSRFAQG